MCPYREVYNTDIDVLARITKLRMSEVIMYNEKHVPWTVFRSVCELVCNLHKDEIRDLERFARELIEKHYRGKNDLDGDLAYEVISSNHVAKKIFDKHGYDSWEKVMRRLSSCEIDDKRRREEDLALFLYAWNGYGESEEEISE